MRTGRVFIGAGTLVVVLCVFAVDHYWTGGFLSAALLSAIALSASYELCEVLERAGIPVFRVATAGASFVVALLPAVVLRAWEGTSPFAPQAGVIFGFMMLAFGMGMRKGNPPWGAKAVIGSTFVLVYVGLSLSFLVRLRDIPVVGEELLLFSIGCAKLGDIGAYFVGRTFGRHQLSPKLSPKKTVEGAFGGVVGSLAAALIVRLLFGGSLGLPTLVVWAVILTVAAQFGDLAESLIKRAADIKDSSPTLGTMGGVLDLVDSLLLSAPVAYILALIWELGAVQG